MEKRKHVAARMKTITSVMNGGLVLVRFQLALEQPEISASKTVKFTQGKRFKDNCGLCRDKAVKAKNCRGLFLRNYELHINSEP